MLSSERSCELAPMGEVSRREPATAWRWYGWRMLGRTFLRLLGTWDTMNRPSVSTSSGSWRAASTGCRIKPHPGPRPKVTEEMLLALDLIIDQSDRTWTTPQLARWLEGEFQIRVHPDHLARLLHRRGFSWKRTKRSVSHKRNDPDLQAAKEAELEELKRSGPGG